jgi:hypothetical protein
VQSNLLDSCWVSNFIHEYESPFHFGTRESSPASFLVFSPPLRVSDFSISGADVRTTVYEDYMVPVLPKADSNTKLIHEARIVDSETPQVVG